MGIGLAAERLGRRRSTRRPSACAPATRRPTSAASCVRNPPDLLITTPESLYLMLTSAARETLRSVEAVIIDEIHALAPTKRGAHLALTLERLDALCERPPQRIGLSATQRPLDEIARFLGGFADGRRARCRAPRPGHHRRRRHPQAARDRGRRAGRGHGRARARSSTSRPAARPRPGRCARSIWPSIHPRLLELVAAAPLDPHLRQRPPPGRAAGHPAQRAGRSRARTGRPRPRAGRPCRATSWSRPTTARCRASAGSRSRTSSSGASSRAWWPPARSSSASTWARSTWSSRSSRPARCRAACSASAGPATRWASRAGASSSPSTATTWSRRPWWCERMHDGLIEHTRYPRNPLDVLAQQIVAMCALDEWPVDELAALVRRAAPLRRADRRGADQRARPAGRALPVRRVRRAAAPHRVGPRQRRRPGPGRRAAPGGHQRRHHPRPRALRRVPARRHPGRRARRGDGLREPRRRDLPARRQHLAHRGHHPRAGHRHARRPGQPGKMPFWHGDGPGRPLELGRALGAFVREIRAAPAPTALERLQRDHGLDALAAAQPGRLPRRAGRGHRRSVPDDRTIVVERFRDEIGDWRVCVLIAVRRPGARAVGHGAAGPPGRAVGHRRRAHVERRRHRAAPARGGRRPARSTSC